MLDVGGIVQSVDSSMVAAIRLGEARSANDPVGSTGDGLVPRPVAVIDAAARRRFGVQVSCVCGAGGVVEFAHAAGDAGFGGVHPATEPFHVAERLGAHIRIRDRDIDGLDRRDGRERIGRVHGSKYDEGVYQSFGRVVSVTRTVDFQVARAGAVNWK